MFTVVCAIPAAGVLMIPSAIAQDDDISLLGDEDEQDGTNAETENQNQDQTVDQDNTATFGDDIVDLDGGNVAAPIAVPLNVEEDEEEENPIPRPTDQGELPPEELPEFVAFCYETGTDFHCYDNAEDCAQGGLMFEVENPECEGLETIPPNAGECNVDENDNGEPIRAECFYFDT